MAERETSSLAKDIVKTEAVAIAFFLATIVFAFLLFAGRR